MASSSLEHHLRSPSCRGPVPDGAVVGSAGGHACGDLVRIALRVEDGRIEDITFDAEGCGAAIAAGSACAKLVAGASVLGAARVGSAEIAAELGGLSPGKRHAAELAADALHRALMRLCEQGDLKLANPSPSRVLVAMSGGVDSAVAALLAQRDGAEVVAVTLKLWADQIGDGTKSCCSPQAVLGARALAHRMDIPHLTLDLEPSFRAAVVDDFIEQHRRGRTPNPCVRCNGLVRFGEMLALVDRIGAAALVTGHYARIESDGKGPLLARATDRAKDQTYMLSGLRPELLERVRFPLSALTKPEVRALARAAQLPVAEKRESQDLCFLAGTSREHFLARHGRLRDVPGEIIDSDGNVLGIHRGHRHFTVGQRRGLGVAAREPLYVIATDAGRNRVLVGARERLAVRHVALAPATLYRDARRVSRVKLRYRSEAVVCTVTTEVAAGSHDRLQIELRDPTNGVAAGQTACLLDGELVVGYGTIESAWAAEAFASKIEPALATVG